MAQLKPYFEYCLLDLLTFLENIDNTLNTFSTERKHHMYLLKTVHFKLFSICSSFIRTRFSILHALARKKGGWREDGGGGEGEIISWKYHFVKLDMGITSLMQSPFGLLNVCNSLS